jgi:hypothetical protein
VCQPATSSALSPASPESRVGAFEDVQAAFVGGLGGATGGLHKGIGEAYDEIASGYRFAAGGTLRPMARSLGAAGDDLLLKKAVNSNLPHAIGRGVERGVFSSADEAGAALRGLTEQITQSGTFPVGTLVDTARTGRFLVPVGNNGMAVYQLAKNGTAKLKTVLIGR